MGTIATMVEYRDRLDSAMRDARVNAIQLAKAMGISYQAVRKVLDGVSKSFSAENNAAAAQELEVSSDWLATGRGPRNLFNPPQPPAVEEPRPEYGPSKFRLVPVVNEVPAGDLPEGSWIDQDSCVATAEVASDDPRAFVVRVSGPNMAPRFNPGEYALIEPGTKPDIEDDVLVRLSNGQTMLKRLLSRRDHVRLGAYNDAAIFTFEKEEVSWMYYAAYPVPARKIKPRS